MKKAEFVRSMVWHVSCVFTVVTGYFCIFCFFACSFFCVDGVVDWFVGIQYILICLIY